jgi:excisionase family DNA binding protein
MMEEPLDINQAARFLGLKPGTVYNMISRRTLPFHKVGRRVLFRQTELEAWFESTLIPCVPDPLSLRKKRRESNADLEVIVKNAVEEFHRN